MMMLYFRSCVALFMGAAALIPCATLHGDETVRFASAQNYTEYFRPMADVRLLRQEGEALVARPAKTFYGGALYTPAGKEASFDSGAVEAGFTLKGEPGGRTVFYLVARYEEETRDAVMGCVFIPSPNRIRLRIIFNLDPYVSIGNQDHQMLVDWEYDVSSGGLGAYREGLNREGCKGGPGLRTLEPGADLIVRLEQRETPTREFCLTVLDEAGEVLGTTGFQSHEQLHIIPPQGSVGMGAYVAPEDEVLISSFTVKPAL